MSYYYKITINVHSPKKPSPFIGSALRGSFGHALKEQSCVNPTYKCEGCFAKERCLYHEFYEQSSGYRPFRFEIEQYQERYDFSLLLFFQEKREEEVALVLEALSLMLRKYGLEKERHLFLQSTFSIDTLSPLEILFLENNSSTLYIKSLTPFILKQSNRKLIKEITLEDILSSLYKRRAFFEEGKAHAKLSFKPSYALLSAKSQYQKTFRYSDAQYKKIPVEGYAVTLAVKNLDQESYELLKYGEVVAVGNDTVRGYGRFVLEYAY